MILVVLFCVFSVSPQSVDYLEKARKSLLDGDVGGAIKTYNDALASDGTRYVSAYFLLGNIYFTQGKLHLAISMYTQYRKTNPANYDEVTLSLVKCSLRLGHFGVAIESLEAAKISDNGKFISMMADIKGAQNALQLAEEYSVDKVEEAIQILENLRKIVTHSSSLLKKLVMLYRSAKKSKEEISTMKFLVKVSPDDANAYHELSLVLLNSCEIGEALDHIRKCLVTDQDHKECSKSYKIQRKVHTYWSKLLEQLGNKQFVETKATGAQLEEFLLLKKFDFACIWNKITLVRCQADSREIKDAKTSMKLCSDAMKLYPSDSDDYYSALLARAHIYVHQGELKLAKNDVDTYLNRHSGDDEAQKLKTKITRLIKQAGRRNYYQILGVSKNARKVDINRAYRKLALKYHPDKHVNVEDKAVAEVKFQDINDAHEVLSDQKKRKMFDNGLDPLDQNDMEESRREEGYHSGGNAHFDPGSFNFFGGGGQFTFNF